MFKSAVLRSLSIVSLLAIILSGCQVKKEKFSTKDWDDGDGLEFPKRDAMLDDLLANHKLKGLTFKQAVALLKYPQRTGFVNKEFEYEIVRKMDGVDTVYFKSLVLYLNPDSIVSGYKVIEKDNKEKLKLKFEKQKAEKK